MTSLNSSSRPRRWSLPARALTALALISLALVAPAASATDAEVSLTCDNGDTFPCGDPIDNLQIQKVPSIFKFQARVSQAKLPIGKGTFSEVIVYLLQNNEPICTEEFQNVEVRESVLNLEIGQNMTCELDEVMATQDGLAFQVCLGSADSCLKPIELASVPYAVGSSYAHRAQSAHDADTSAVAHYAFRASADRDINLLDAISTGYFDFHSRDGSAGYFQWAPTKDDTQPVLWITGVDHSTGGELQLDELHLDSLTTTATGNVVVNGEAKINQALTADEDVTVEGATELKLGVTVGTSDNAGVGTLQVWGETTLETALTVKAGGLDIQGDGLQVTGLANFNDGQTTTGDAWFSADVTSAGDFVTNGALALLPAQTTTTTGYAALELGATDDGTDILVLGPRSPANPALAQIPEVHVDGPLAINSTMSTFDTAVFGAETQHEGTVVFKGAVDFRDATDILGLQIGEDGQGVVLGNWSFQGEFMNHNGISVLQGKSGTDDLTILGAVDVDGTAVMHGGLSVLGTSAGTTAIFGVDSFFNEDTTFGGTMYMKFVTGSTSELFKPRTDGSVHVDDNRQLSELVIEADTRFSANTTVTVQGLLVAASSMQVSETLTVDDWLYIGDGWRFRDGNGLQHIDASGGFSRVLSTTGNNRIVLDQDGGFANGVRTGGQLEVDGLTRADAGLEVRTSNTLQVSVDSTQARFFSRAQVDGEFEVKTGGSSRLDVTSAGVTLSGAHQINGSVSIGGTAEFTNGLGGSGEVRTTTGSCVTTPGTCPAGYWSTGVVDAYSTCGGFWFNNCTVQIVTRCCEVHLAN